MLNMWDPFTVFVIDVDVVIFGVGLDQDKEDEEEELAEVDSQQGNIGWELGETIRPIYWEDLDRDKKILMFGCWENLRFGQLLEREVAERWLFSYYFVHTAF